MKAQLKPAAAVTDAARALNAARQATDVSAAIVREADAAHEAALDKRRAAAGADDATLDKLDSAVDAARNAATRATERATIAATALLGHESGHADAVKADAVERLSALRTQAAIEIPARKVEALRAVLTAIRDIADLECAGDALKHAAGQSTRTSFESSVLASAHLGEEIISREIVEMPVDQFGSIVETALPGTRTEQFEKLSIRIPRIPLGFAALARSLMLPGLATGNDLLWETEWGTESPARIAALARESLAKLDRQVEALRTGEVIRKTGVRYQQAPRI